jgi:hypothetical protein
MMMLVASSAFAADVTGKWNATVQGPQGPVELVFDLKADGDKVSGAVGVAQMPGTAITDGKVKGNELTFKLPFPAGPAGGGAPGAAPPTIVIDYKGKVDGDTIDFTSTIAGAPGGPPVVTEFKANRAK